jgi:hypothetical protein
MKLTNIWFRTLFWSFVHLIKILYCSASNTGWKVNRCPYSNHCNSCTTYVQTRYMQPTKHEGSWQNSIFFPQRGCFNLYLPKPRKHANDIIMKIVFISQSHSQFSSLLLLLRLLPCVYLGHLVSLLGKTGPPKSRIDKHHVKFPLHATTACTDSPGNVFFPSAHSHTKSDPMRTGWY